MREALNADSFNAQRALFELLNPSSEAWPEHLLSVLKHDQLDQLSDVLDTAAAVSELSDRRILQERATSDALAKLGIPVLLLDHQGQLLFCPPVARDVLVECGEVHGRDLNHLHRDAKILQAMRQMQRQPGSSQTAFPLTNSIVAELHMVADYGARVILNRFEDRVELASKKIAQLYSLTEAERRVIAELSKGKAIKEIADEHDVQQATIRSQLKSIYRKLNVNHQAAVVSLCLANSYISVSPVQKESSLDYRLIACADGQLMSYREFGDPEGIPSVWLHDFTNGSAFYAPLDLACRERGIRMICPDRPGFGASMAAELNTNDYLEHQLQRLEGFAEALALKRFALVSFQNAGNIALRWCHKQPNKISSLLMLGATIRPKPETLKQVLAEVHPFHRAVVDLGSRHPRLFLKLMPIVFKSAYTTPNAYFRAVRKGLCEPDRKAIDGPDLIPQMVLAGQMAVTDYKVPAYDAWASMQTDREQIYQLKTPLCIWQGVQDQTTPWQLAAEVKKDMPKTAVTLAEDAGKLAIFTHTEQVLDNTYELVFASVNRL